MLKRWVFLISLAVLVYLFWPLVGDIRASLALFRQIRPEFLALVILLQIGGYACLTWLNLLCLAPFPGRVPFGRLMAMLAALAFVQTALPSAGASGIALRARLLGGNGYSFEAATFSLALETALLTLTIGLFSAFGVASLLQESQLTLLQFSLLLLSLLALITTGAFWLAYAARDVHQMRQRVLRLAVYWDRLMQRFHRRGPSPAEVERRVEAFYRGLQLLRHAPRWPFVVSAMGRVGFDIASLAACFWAFSYPISLDITLIGYGITIAVSSLGAVPGGLGIGDASMAVVFTRLGAPAAIVLAAVLLYRLLSYWLLRFIGFISWQILEHLRER